MPFVIALAVAWGRLVSKLIQTFGVMRVVGSALCAFLVSGLLMAGHSRFANVLGLLIGLPVGLTIAFGVPFTIFRGILRRSPALTSFTSAQPPYNGWWLLPLRVIAGVVVAISLASLGVGVLFGIVALLVQLGKLADF